MNDVRAFLLVLMGSSPIAPATPGDNPALWRATTDTATRLLTDGTTRALQLLTNPRVVTSGPMRVTTDGAIRCPTH